MLPALPAPVPADAPAGVPPDAGAALPPPPSVALGTLAPDRAVVIVDGSSSQQAADQVLPIDKTANRLPGLIKDMQLTVVEGGPHAILWTHAGQINSALLDFLHR